MTEPSRTTAALDAWLPVCVAVAWIVGGIGLTLTGDCAATAPGVPFAGTAAFVGTLLLARVSACGVLLALPAAVGTARARRVAVIAGLVLVGSMTAIGWLVVPALHDSLLSTPRLQSPDPFSWGLVDLISALTTGRSPLGTPLDGMQASRVWGLAWYRLAMLLALGLPFLAASLLRTQRRRPWWLTVPIGLVLGEVVVRSAARLPPPAEGSAWGGALLLVLAVPAAVVSVGLIVADRRAGVAKSEGG